MLNFDTIYGKTIKNEIYIENDKFYSGIHWKTLGIQTTDGKMAIDKVNPNKIYNGVVVNFVQDAVDSFVNFSNGIGEEKIISEDENTKNIIKEFNLEQHFDEITKKMLITGNSYLYFYTNNENEFSTQVLSNQNCYTIEENNKIIEAYVVEVEKISDYGNKTTVIHYTENNDKNIYVDGKLLKTEKYGIIPLIKFGNGQPFVTKNLKSINSDINITYSRIDDIEKYFSNPLLAITGISANTLKTLKIDASQALKIADKDAKVNRFSSEGVNDGVLKTLLSKKKDFYRLAKLSAIKDEDVLVGESSGVAMLLKMVDTTAKTDEIRSMLRNGFNKFFYTLVEIGYIKNYSFKLQKTIFGDVQERQKQNDRIELEKSRIELIKSYIEIGYTKDEALKIIENLG